VIVDAGGRYVRVTEPFLDFSDVGLVIQSIGGGGGAQRMRSDFKPQPRGIGSYEQIYAVGCERALEGLAAVVFHRAEQRAVLIEGVAGCIEIVVNESVGARMEREISRLLALARDPQMRDAAARLVKILDLKLAEFVAAQRVKQQRR